MNETEKMLWILDRVSSIKLHYDDIEGEYIGEVLTIGKTDYFFRRDSTYERMLSSVKEQLIALGK